MSGAPRLGAPTSIGTHDDGRVTVEFDWAEAPDAVWLRSMANLMRRSGRETITVTGDGLSTTFDPQAAEDALDELTDLLADADRLYLQDIEQRDAAVQHVKETLRDRFGPGPDLPVREV